MEVDDNIGRDDWKMVLDGFTYTPGLSRWIFVRVGLSESHQRTQYGAEPAGQPFANRTEIVTEESGYLPCDGSWDFPFTFIDKTDKIDGNFLLDSLITSGLSRY